MTPGTPDAALSNAVAAAIRAADGDHTMGAAALADVALAAAGRVLAAEWRSKAAAVRLSPARGNSFGAGLARALDAQAWERAAADVERLCGVPEGAGGGEG